MKTIKVQYKEGGKAYFYRICENKGVRKGAYISFDGATKVKVLEVINTEYRSVNLITNQISQDFNEDQNAECATGIHFFMNKQDAIDYTPYL